MCRQRHLLFAGGFSVRSCSGQENSIRGMFSCTLLAVFVCFGRFQGGVYKIMTKEGDNEVRWSSVQGGGERTGGVSDPLPELQATAFGL